MKRLIEYFLKVFFPGYILFSLFTLTNCSKNSDGDEQSYTHLQQHIKETEQQLIKEYHINTFECSKINSILNQKILLDSTIVGVVERRGGYYFKASINNSCDRKIFAILKCSPKILDDYESFKSNRAYIVASINKIDSIKNIAETDTLDGKSNYINGNDSILLTGECQVLEEILIYSSPN